MMKIIDYGLQFDKQIVLVLGYFDSLHEGHLSLINRAKQLSYELDCQVAVFTFSNDLRCQMGGQKGMVLTYFERLKRLKELSITNVVVANFNDQFKNKTAEDFLLEMQANLNIKALVCGTDYTFGKGGKGNCATLIEYCNNCNCQICVVEDFMMNGKKVSTTLIKEQLQMGNIEQANLMLGDCYSVSGTVVKGRQVGKKLGFPTVNLAVDSSKFLPKLGVYLGHTTIENVQYKCIINIGSRPTFSLEEVIIEGHIIDFEGQLYGKEVRLYVDKRIRDIKKFQSEEQLKEQLLMDRQVK